MRQHIVQITAVILSTCCWSTGWSANGGRPVWDLSRDAGAISEAVRRDGSVPLDLRHSFKVPHTAVRDSSAFTVEMRIRCDNPQDKTQLSLLRQRTANTGWGLDISLSAALGSLVDMTINDAPMMAGWFRTKPGEEHTFVVTARKGLTVVYLDGRCLARFRSLIVQNLEPIEVGGVWSKRFPEMQGFKLLALRFWGPEYEFYLPGESRAYADGFKGGPGWMVNCPTENADIPLPRILCYGDSILSGYGDILRSKLKGKAYVYLWRNFVGSPQGADLDIKPFISAASVAKFDAVVFNNGLHSLHWTESAVGDDLVRATQRRIYEGLRTGAPQATFYWLATTPHTAGRDKGSGKVLSTGSLDAVVRRINRLTADELGRDGVQVVDAYSLLRARLDLAAGDGYHWAYAGYDLLADRIVGVLQENLFGLVWRGFLLDEARHFFGKKIVFECLDMMARHKLNVLHWHLTDDQGWRLNLPDFPELVKYGAVRLSSPIPGKGDTSSDGIPYGPYAYTIDDVREIVDYAGNRGILVVPEIDLPGHTRALLAAHPEFACDGRRISRYAWCHYGVAEDVLCVGNEKACQYVERILAAVTEAFPSKFVHIGGDECPRTRWKACPKCQAALRRDGLTDEAALQAVFMRRMSRFLASRGRRAVVWHEAFEGGALPQQVVVQCWKDEAVACRAAEKGHDVIVSPLDYTYFTLPEGVKDDPYVYRSWVKGKTLSQEKMRSFDPFKGIPLPLTSRVLGAECCAWSEFIHNEEELRFKVLRRLPAFASAVSGARARGCE